MITRRFLSWGWERREAGTGNREAVAFCLFKYWLINLAALGLTCSLWDLVPDQGLSLGAPLPAPLHWELRAGAADHEGSATAGVW